MELSKLHKATILNAIGLSKDLSPGEIRENLGLGINEKGYAALGGRLFSYATAGQLTKKKRPGRKGKGGNVYSLTPAGKKWITTNFHLVQAAWLPLDSATEEQQLTLGDMNVAQPPVEVNISSTANGVVDGISALVNENSEYRDLLLKLYQTIGNTLGLNDNKENTNG
jgi:hypothetical protein